MITKSKYSELLEELRKIGHEAQADAERIDPSNSLHRVARLEHVANGLMWINAQMLKELERRDGFGSEGMMNTEMYVVMTLHRDVEISGLAGVRTVPLTYLDGMVGVMPVFASRSEAEKFAAGTYGVMKIAITPSAIYTPDGV